MTTKFNIHQVVQMRDAHKTLSDGDKGYIFSWDFRRRIAQNFILLEQAIASFEQSRNAITLKHGGTAEDRVLIEGHPNYAEWVTEMLTLSKEEIDLEGIKTLNVNEFNGDENRTLPADILIKLNPILVG